MDVLGTVWRQVSATQPAPEPWVIGATAAVAAVLVLEPSAWSLSRHVVTLVHEGAHGAAALATGRRLAGIRLHSDTSGLTVSVGRRTGPGMVVTLAAGYVGPALVGLAAALVLGTGHALAMLWIVVALLGLMLLQIRNWFGFLPVLVSGGVVGAVSWWGSDAVQSAFAYGVTWFLLLAAPRPVLELARKRRRGRAPTSDADQLARLTGLPGIGWVAAFLSVTVAALVLGGVSLLT